MMNIVAFLIEHFPNIHVCPEGNALGRLLENAGFGDEDIHHALLFIHLLNEQADYTAPELATGYNQFMRLYTPEEMEILSAEIRSFLHQSEREHAINPEQREWIIHSLMFLPEEEVTLEMAKMLTVLILWAQQTQLPMNLSEDLMISWYKKGVKH